VFVPGSTQAPIPFGVSPERPRKRGDIPTPHRPITRVNDAVGRGQLAPLRGMLIAWSRRGGLQVSQQGSGPLRGIAEIRNGDRTDGEF